MWSSVYFISDKAQYSPFGNQNDIYDSGKNIGKLIEDKVLVEIGEKHGKSAAVVEVGEVEAAVESPSNLGLQRGVPAAEVP